MPCAMSSLRGASGVVGCDRVVCPLVLHATTIAHLDVLLCTLLCFLLCALSALLLCVCPVVCPVPCLPCLWCVCVVLWLWCVGASCPCSPCPCGCVLRCAPVPLCFSCLFSGHNTCPIYGCVICGPYTLPICVPYFLGLVFMIRSAHTAKAGPWIPNVDFQKSA
jgi:hypothetical protein